MLRQWPLAISWTALAALSVNYTRFDGTVAFLWASTGLLIAALMRTSMHHWWAPLWVCGVASFINTSLLGFGYATALPFVVINLGEAMAAAWLMRRQHDRNELMASPTWLGRLLFAMIAAPLLLSPVAVATLWLAGGADPLNTFIRFMAGHSLGNLTAVPMALLLSGKSARRETRDILRERRGQALVTLPMVAAVCGFVFWQTSWSLLFLPALAVIVATFRLGRVGAALSLAILAVVGGFGTALERGPIQLTVTDLGNQLQFFQFYLAATVLTVLPLAADLHRRRKLVRDLKRSEAQFRLLADSSTDVIMRISAEGHILYASPSVANFCGYSSEELVGRHSRLLIDEGDLERVIEEHQATLAAGGEARTYEYRGRNRHGDKRWFSTHARALLNDEGEAYELLAVIRDVTDSKRSELALTEAALTDLLTGLPNRRAFEGAIAGLRPGQHCIALFDVDHFKAVNDTYGHDVGDAVLKGFADFAGRAVRCHDLLARLGGEEFIVLFEHTGPEQAYQICDRLRQMLAATAFATEAGPLRITVSGGVAEVGRGGLARAYKAADEALYRAKRGGRDRLLIAA